MINKNNKFFVKNIFFIFLINLNLLNCLNVEIKNYLAEKIYSYILSLHKGNFIAIMPIVFIGYLINYKIDKNQKINNIFKYFKKYKDLLDVFKIFKFKI